jgi:hypothetical protein
VTTNFLGIEIDGNIIKAEGKPQRPLEEFAPILQAVLNDPTIVEFGWKQRTPYFNDGDPCKFSAFGAWVRTTSDGAAGDDDYDRDGLEVYCNEHLGERPRTWNTETRTYDVGSYVGDDEARYDRCHALSAAIEDGEFYEVLLTAFGDHAEVTVRRDGIKVEFYDHD